MMIAISFTNFQNPQLCMKFIEINDAITCHYFCNCCCNNCQNCLLGFYMVSTMQGSENSIAIKLFIAMKCCNSNIALCILNYEMEML